MPTELIVGGDFEAPGYSGVYVVTNNYGSWSGNAIEVGDHTNYHTGASSSNSSVELDAFGSETSVVEQSFVVDAAGRDATLSFDAGGRNAGTIANDPFLVEVVNSSGTVIFTQTVTPSSTGNFDTYTFNFTFPTADTFTLRFTEQGTDDGNGTTLDNVSLVVCFASGTDITTPGGEVKIEDLKVGDLVSTIDGDAKPIQWIGSRKLTQDDLNANPNAKPIILRKNSLGDNMPQKDLRVSAQHRILVRSKVSQRVLGALEALVPAKKLTAIDGVDVQENCEEITYFHFALEEHDIVLAQGAYAESLYLGEGALTTLGSAAVKELAYLFPGLLTADFAPKPARALRSRNKDIEKLCVRSAKNNKPLVDIEL